MRDGYEEGVRILSVYDRKDEELRVAEMSFIIHKIINYYHVTVHVEFSSIEIEFKGFCSLQNVHHRASFY